MKKQLIEKGYAVKTGKGESATYSLTEKGVVFAQQVVEKYNYVKSGRELFGGSAGLQSNSQLSCNSNASKHAAAKEVTCVIDEGGAGDDDTKCCMCGKKVDKDNSLMPSECKIKYGSRAHRICEECWFKPETGFAIEGRSHKCPGCEKGLPLTHVEQKPIEVVDLTGDD